MFAFFARAFFLMGAGLGLAACMSVPVTSLPKLAAMSPETMDISAMEVAVRAPEAFELPAGSSRLTFSVWREEGDQTREEAFDLIPVEGPLTRVLNGKQKAGYTIHRLQVAPEDAPRVAAFRDYALSLKGTPGKKSLSMSASARPCLTPGENPFRDPRVTIFLRMKPEEDYFTLIKERAVPLAMPDGKVRYCEAG